MNINSLYNVIDNNTNNGETNKKKNMKKNMGSYDKLIRLSIAISLIILYYNDILKDTLGIIALIVALIFTVTSLISFCPLYSIFGIKTCKKEES